MIRVMIVEDEPPIAQSIQTLAESREGIQVVHTAINGMRALEYLQDHGVDLVFTDIKMPLMGGLELAKNLSERYPEVITVIISGFQDFEFARTAIRYGVHNYLLKPVSREQVHEVLNAVSEELGKRAEESRRRFLEQAATTRHTTTGAGEDLCGVALVCGGAYPLTPDELLPDGGHVPESEVIEEYVTRHLGAASCICVAGKSNAERVVAFTADNEDEIETLSERLYDYLAGLCDLRVTMAVWDRAVPLGEVGGVLRKLRRFLKQELRLFRGQLLRWGQPLSEELEVADQPELSLLAALNTRDPEAVRQAAAELVDVFAGAGARQNEFMMRLEKLAISFFGPELSAQRLGELQYDLQSAVTTSSSPEELGGELGEIFAARVRAEQPTDSDQTQGLCEEAAAYIRLHHKDGIAIPELGRRFGVSATRLAKQFKDYHGLTISEYVNKYRIDLAKSMLRSNHRLMVKEVALEVGYNDQYYFSKIFKKLTGVWPTEFLAAEPGKTEEES